MHELMVLYYRSRKDSQFEQSRANRKINYSALGALFYEILIHKRSQINVIVVPQFPDVSINNEINYSVISQHYDELNDK